MRPDFKYKGLSKQKLLPLDISWRIFNFHRTKWLRLKKKIEFFIKKKNKILEKSKEKHDKSEIFPLTEKKFKHFNKPIIKGVIWKEKYHLELLKKLSRSISFLKSKKTTSKKSFFYKTNLIRISKQWLSLKRYHKRILNIKHYYVYRFDGTIVNKTLKKRLKQEKNSTLNFLYQKYLVVPYLKIDVLLWKTYFFRSAFESREFFHKKSVFLNFKNMLKDNYPLKKGDSVILKKKVSLREQTNTTAIKPNLIMSKLISDFIDKEYFSNIVFILKSLEESAHDKLFFVLENKFFDVRLLKDYCLK